jgi:Tfp pilus assembly protein PilP
MQKNDHGNNAISEEMATLLNSNISNEKYSAIADCPMSEMVIAYAFEELEPGDMPEVQDHLATCRLCDILVQDVRSADTESRLNSDQPVKILPALSTAIEHAKKPALRKKIRMPDFSLGSIYPKLIGAFATACLALIIIEYGMQDPQPFEALKKTIDRRAPISKKIARPETGQKALKGPDQPASKNYSINSISTNKKTTIDPFEDPFKAGSASSIKTKKVKRIPLTPLEKLDLGQLKLVGIILSATGNRAIVEDAAGKGFVLREGTYVGRNSGRVTKILKEKVVIEEEIENDDGQIIILERELNLNKR